MKHGDDYKKLMKYLYQDGYLLKRITTELGKIKGTDNSFDGKVSFVLEKQGEEVIFETCEDDAMMLGWHLHSFPRINDEKGFYQVKDVNKYFADIEFLVDMDRKKVNDAREKIQRGEFKFTYNPELLIEEYLSESKDRSYTRSKYVPLRNDYFEIQVHFIGTLVSLNSMIEKFNAVYPDFKESNTFLFNRLLRFTKSDNHMLAYKKLVDMLEIKPIENLNTYLDIRNDAIEVSKLIRNSYGDSTHVGNVITRLLEMYRKLSEFTAPFIKLFANVESLKQKNGKELGFSGSHKQLIKLPEYSKYLRCLDPRIRNSESHLSTKIDKDRESIVIRDKKRKVLKEYKYREFAQMLMDLDNGLAPALVASLVSVYLISLVMVLDSYEYKMLLVGIGNRS